MENRKGTLPNRRNRPVRSAAIFYLLFSIFILAAGCGAPGEPVPPIPPVPQPILDLTAKQLGDGVLLIFTMPGKSTLGDSLPQAPTIEISRGALRPDGAPDLKSFRVADTIPGALVPRYSQHGQIEFLDPIAPTDPQLRTGQPFLYRVQTLISAKHPSANSNTVSIRLYPVAEAIASLNATVTEQGIELKWTPPARTTSGDPLAAVKEYRVYRGEPNPVATGQPAPESTQSPWKSPLMQLGVTSTPDYRDSGFDYGKTYAYIVRTVVDSPAGPLESSDSNQAVVTPKDVFPPAAPAGIVAAIEPGATPSSSVVELSWSINLEPDLAGYRVYRSDQEGTRGSMITPELLPSPAYRDTSVQSGRQYRYFVTAVDRTGNESAPSPAVSVDLAQPSR